MVLVLGLPDCFWMCNCFGSEGVVYSLSWHWVPCLQPWQYFFLLPFFFTFLLASCWFATDDLPGLANCVTWYSFLFSLYIFIPSFSFLCFCFFNKGWCSRYSFQACLLFFFLSLSFWCTSERQTGSSLILAFYLCFLSVLWLICPSIPFFTVCPPLFLVLIS